MKKRIHILTIGKMPPGLNLGRISKWKSEVFEIIPEIDEYDLTANSDMDGWTYSDQLLLAQLPQEIRGDFAFVIVNVPLQLNWYSRRASENIVFFTYHQINDILGYANIPLENIILRLLYSYVLLHFSYGRIPPIYELLDFTHDETRGCIYDMNGLKYDVVLSCHKTQICPECIQRMRENRVPNKILSSAAKEVKRIKKGWYIRVTEFIGTHPFWTIAITTFYGILIGVIGSVIGALIYSR